MGEPAIALLVALALCAVHVFVGRLRFLEGVPRSRWLSAAGGGAVAYIFLHLLPDLSAAHQAQGIPGERFFFVIALAGLVAFYGVERRVRAGGGGEEHSGAFWLHVGSFALYNLLIGYLLLHREAGGQGALLLYGGAMALHFLSSDYGMRLDHRGAYDRTARWVLCGALLAGWVVGWQLELPQTAVDGLFALLGGGVVLNVMKEELPEERQSRFGAFLVGTVAYSLLLLAI